MFRSSCVSCAPETLSNANCSAMLSHFQLNRNAVFIPPYAIPSRWPRDQRQLHRKKTLLIVTSRIRFSIRQATDRPQLDSGNSKYQKIGLALVSSWRPFSGAQPNDWSDPLPRIADRKEDGTDGLLQICPSCYLEVQSVASLIGVHRRPIRTHENARTAG
jgi:hypothetical protein